MGGQQFGSLFTGDAVQPLPVAGSFIGVIPGTGHQQQTDGVGLGFLGPTVRKGDTLGRLQPVDILHDVDPV